MRLFITQSKLALSAVVISMGMFMIAACGDKDNPQFTPDVGYVDTDGELPEDPVPCEPGSGPCCDDESGVLLGSDMACDSDSAGASVRYECTDPGCGATLLQVEVTEQQYCSGISAECDGEVLELEGDLEVAEVCPDTHLCDEGAQGCVPSVLCGDYCDDGPCCDLETNTYHSSDYACDAEMGENFTCSTSQCGGVVQRTTLQQFCTGNSSQCEGAVAWTEWQDSEVCSATEVCRIDDQNQAACVEDRVNCDSTYCSSGPCCDTDNNTLISSDQVCESALREDFRCSDNGCGANLEKNIIDKYCSGTSNLCTGQEMGRGWEMAQDCLQTETCDLDTRACVDTPVCHDNFCVDGPCCDTDTNTLLGADHLCAFNQDYEESCESSTPTCGDSVLSRSRVQFCSGSSYVCDGRLEWEEWQTKESCGAGQTCTEVSSDSAVCFDNHVLCDESFCDSGPCCDIDTNTLLGPEVICAPAVSEDLRCAGEVCGGTLERNISDQFCSGTSSLCEGEPVERGWEVEEVCSETETCDLDLAICLEESFCSSIVAVSAGDWFSMALSPSGTILAWGANEAGQLGTGNKEGSSLPVPVMAAGGVEVFSGAAELSGGGNYSVAVRSDGTVWSWGNNERGKLGVGGGTGGERLYPTQVLGPNGEGFLSGAVSAIATRRHTMAILSEDGVLYAWGRNSEGQLGIGSFSVGSDVPVAVAGHPDVGERFTGVLMVDGNLDFTIARRDDGSVWCWGRNDRGQLGNGDGGQEAPNVNSPQRVVSPPGSGAPFLTDVVDIAAGEKFSMALLSDGTVVSWGANNQGQLGNGTTEDRYQPQSVRNSDDTDVLSNIQAISAGAEHAMALDRDGRVWAWGNNGSGRLGFGDVASPQPLPRLVSDPEGIGPLEGVGAVSAGNQFSAALDQDGMVWTWGRNNNGQLGTGDFSNSLVPILVSID